VITAAAVRETWLSPDLKCPTCGKLYHAAKSAGDLWLVCQFKRCDRTRWRAVAIYPHMIGASLEMLFGEQRGREILHHLHPASRSLSDEDQLGYDLIRSGKVEYLQWKVSKLEENRDSQDPVMARRVLKALGGM
jgi:hypothetical protein